MPELPAVDREAIGRLREWGGEALAARMIDIFLEHSTERIIQIREGVADDDAGAAGTGAHSLKSSAANVGAFRLQALCQSAEMLAASADLVALKGLLGELEEAHRDAREALEEILEGMMG